MDNRARMALTAMDRWQKRADEATARAEEARAELLALHQAAEARIGRPVPADAQLLDVLDLIEIGPDDAWIWLGVRNNKDLATIRIRPGNLEVSAVRFLAVAFGVIAEDEWGTLQPTNGPDDVNPWHRTLRPSERPINTDDDRFTVAYKGPWPDTEEFLFMHNELSDLARPSMYLSCPACGYGEAVMGAAALTCCACGCEFVDPAP